MTQLFYFGTFLSLDFIIFLLENQIFSFDAHLQRNGLGLNETFMTDISILYVCLQQNNEPEIAYV